MEHGAYILARYSTSNQNETSIEVQVEKCSEWCQQNGLRILDIFADYAVSGMKQTRPQYDRMMRLLEAGGADTVVIYDQSRMFRDMVLWFQFRAELEALGVRVVSVTQPTVGGDLRDPAIFLNEGVTALFNQMWVLQSQQKSRAGMQHRAKSGKHTGGTPALGYRVENEYLVIDEEEAETVRLIFDMYAAGNGYTSIIKELNSRGLKTKRGKPFGKNSLHDLLKNEKYAGRAPFGGKPVASDGSRNSHAKRNENCIMRECPAIVDEATFQAVQKRLEENRRSTGRTVTVMEQPLKGKVFCGDCGSAMTIFYSYTKTSQRYAYYKCAAKKRGLECPGRQIRKDELEADVSQAVRSQMEGQTARKQLIEILRQQREVIQSTAAPRIESIRSEMSKLDTKLDNATDAVLSGLSSPALLKKINDMEKEKAALQERLEACQAAMRHSDIDDARIESLLDELVEKSAGDSSIWLSIVVRVEVCADTLKIWTILDDDPKGSPEKALTKHTISTVAPIDDDIAYNCGCSLRRTIIYTQSVLVIALCMPRRKA